MVVNSDKERYLIGEQIVLEARLYEGGDGGRFSDHQFTTGNAIDDALVVAKLSLPNVSNPDDYPVLVLDNIGNGSYRATYNAIEIGSYKFIINATDAANVTPGSDPNVTINENYLIRAEHSVYVSNNLIPEVFSGGKAKIQQALALLKSIPQSSLTSRQKNRLNSAIRSIENNALRSRNFIDDNNLSNYGLQFYDALKSAVNELTELTTVPASKNQVLEAYRLLYEGSRIFAEYAIEDATANCVVSNCTQILNSATSELGKALREFEKGNIVNVFNHLTNSWKFAQQALGTSLKKENLDDDNSNLPTEYGIEQNYPNPFNPSTEIRYQLPENNFVTIEIFDILGSKITTLVNGEMEAGYHSVTWNAGNLASGVYFYKIQSGSFVSTKKLMLLK